VSSLGGVLLDVIKASALLRLLSGLTCLALIAAVVLTFDEGRFHDSDHSVAAGSDVEAEAGGELVLGRFDRTGSTTGLAGNGGKQSAYSVVLPPSSSILSPRMAQNATDVTPPTGVRLATPTSVGYTGAGIAASVTASSAAHASPSVYGPIDQTTTTPSTVVTNLPVPTANYPAFVSSGVPLSPTTTVHGEGEASVGDSHWVPPRRWGGHWGS